MPSRDTAQLILEVDARIATAQRAVNQLARAVQSDSSAMEKALGGVEKAHARIGRALNDNGRIRSGFTQLSFQIGDVTQQMALGTRASTIFAQQSGQVIQALQLMGGEGNKFLRFLGGPWGIAISTAAVILGTLVPKLLDNKDAVGDLVAKMREQAAQAAKNKQADDIWKNSIEGVTEAIRKRREEQEKARLSDVRAEQESLAEAGKQLRITEGTLTEKTRQLEKAIKTLQTLRQQLNEGGGGAKGGTTASQVAEAEAKVARLRGEVQDLITGVNKGAEAIRGAQADILKRQAEGAVDPMKKMADSVALQIDELTGKFIKGQIGPAAYRKEIEKLTKALKDAKDTASSAGNQFGRQVDFAEAASIARAAGLQVNSAYRSPAQQAVLFNNPAVNRPGNPVAPPGASAHNGANGKWAIDIQITDGVTPGKIRKIFADQGVSLTKVLKEKGHFHVEGSRSEAARGENQAAREAEKAAEDAKNRNQAFNSELDSLNAALLRAKGDLVEGDEAQADFALKMLDVEQKNYEKALDRQVADGKLNELDATLLKLKRQEVTDEQAKAIELNRRLRQLQRRSEIEQREFEYKIDDLRFADEMATTQASHRNLQLQIIDIVYQQKEAALRDLQARLELAGKIEEAADVQAQINRLPTERAQDQARAREGAQGPMESYLDAIPDSADEITEALEQINTQGFDAIADGIAGVISGTQSMGDAFRSVAQQMIAEMTRLIVKMLLLKAIQAATGTGGFDSAGFAATESSNALALGLPSNFFRASGGPVKRGQPYIVGEKRPELFIPDTNGFILPRVPNMSSGSTYNISVTAPNTGDRRRDRITALQQAGMVREAIAISTQKGAR